MARARRRGGGRGLAPPLVPRRFLPGREARPLRGLRRPAGLGCGQVLRPARDGDGGGEDEEGEEGEEAEAFYVPLPPTALPTAPAYAGALALSGRPAAGMKGAGA